MSTLTDFEELRRQRNQKKLRKKLGVTLLVALSGLGGIYLMHRFRQADIPQTLGVIASQFEEGEGYPIATYGGRVRQMDRAGGNVLLLTDNNLYSITPGGKVQMNLSHNYFNPAMAVTPNRALLYDRDGTNLRVEAKFKPLWSKSFQNSIITADMNQDGQLAVATGSSRYKGEVTVFNKDFQEIYYWFSAENRILALSLAERGNRMAVGTVDVSGGMLRSIVNLFRMSSDREEAKVVLEDELLLSLDYKGDILVAVTNKSLYAISTDGVIQKQFSFGDQTLWAFYSGDESGLTVALGDYTEQRELLCYRFGLDLAPRGPALIKEPLLDIKCDSSGSYILTDNHLYTFDTEMQPTGTYDVPEAKVIQPLKNQVYYATGEKVDRAADQPAKE